MHIEKISMMKDKFLKKDEIKKRSKEKVIDLVEIGNPIQFIGCFKDRV